MARQDSARGIGIFLYAALTGGCLVALIILSWASRQPPVFRNTRDHAPYSSDGMAHAVSALRIDVLADGAACTSTTADVNTCSRWLEAVYDVEYARAPGSHTVDGSVCGVRVAWAKHRHTHVAISRIAARSIDWDDVLVEALRVWHIDMAGFTISQVMDGAAQDRVRRTSACRNGRAGLQPASGWEELRDVVWPHAGDDDTDTTHGNLPHARVEATLGAAVARASQALARLAGADNANALIVATPDAEWDCASNTLSAREMAVATFMAVVRGSCGMRDPERRLALDISRDHAVPLADRVEVRIGLIALDGAPLRWVSDRARPECTFSDNDKGDRTDGDGFWERAWDIITRGPGAPSHPRARSRCRRQHQRGSMQAEWVGWMPW